MPILKFVGDKVMEPAVKLLSGFGCHVPTINAGIPTEASGLAYTSGSLLNHLVVIALPY
jgi:hypothetical protein